jgi:hypothetical protein
MRTSLALFALLGSLYSPALWAERGIEAVAQPLSLLGTEADGDPLGDGESIAAIIMTRPTVVGGAYPESVVHAMCLPHQIADAPENFPKESNLIVMVGANITAEWGEANHTVIADFSQASIDEDSGATLLQVMQITAICLQQNLESRSDGKPIKILWKAPQDLVIPEGSLPDEIKYAG